MGPHSAEVGVGDLDGAAVDQPEAGDDAAAQVADQLRERRLIGRGAALEVLDDGLDARGVLGGDRRLEGAQVEGPGLERDEPALGAGQRAR